MNSTDHHDKLTRFYFGDLPVRGVAVCLQQSFIECLNGRSYEQAVTQLLGQCLAAATLMSANFKQTATLSLQARGSGPLTLLMAESVAQAGNTGRSCIRGVARTSHQHSSPEAEIDKELFNKTNDDSRSNTLETLFGDAHLAITIEPETGQRYQGIVELRQSTLAENLAGYFAHSEQLPTHLLLFADQQRAAGIMLQQMPGTPGEMTTADIQTSLADDSGQSPNAHWEELVTLCSTITADELYNLPASEVLYRLFHQHDVRSAEATDVRFECSCSQQRTARALAHIDTREIETILREDGEIVMDCEFCSSRYRFSRQDVEQLLVQQQAHSDLH